MNSATWQRHERSLVVAVLALAAERLCRRPLFETLDSLARELGIKADSEEFDLAAAVAGLPYCRALDLYVDPATKARAEALHFTEAHLALG